MPEIESTPAKTAPNDVPEPSAEEKSRPSVWVLGLIGAVLTLMVFALIWLDEQPWVSPEANETIKQSSSSPTPSLTATPALPMFHLRQLLEEVPNTLVVYPDDQRADEYPPETYKGPVSVIAVDTGATSCDTAKIRTYNLIKRVYTQTALKGFIEKIQITSPGYLRVSLGRTDGDGLTRRDAWSGMTNFYALLFDRFEGEPRSVADRDATWVESINGCR